MKKIKIGTSFIILVIICLIFHNLLVIMNYFLALFLHELAHFIVAIKRGYTIKQFRIDLFGMAVDIDSDIKSRDCFIVNFAGPLMNFILCIICVVVSLVVPQTLNYLQTFFVANLSLALFNLVPIYPLDGGKIFRGMIKDERFFKLDFIIRVTLASVFSLLFIFLISNPNWFFLLFVIFLVQTRNTQTKFSKRKIDKITINVLREDSTLYDSLRYLNSNEYSIFYINNSYIDENNLYEYFLHYPLNYKIIDINKKKR